MLSIVLSLRPLTNACKVLPHAGAGAGQAVEDGWILGRVLGEYVGKQSLDILPTLDACADLYQNLRLPRAQKVQATSRKSGPLYDMQLPELIDKDVEECVPIMANTLQEKMKFIWEADLDRAYEDVKEALRRTNKNVSLMQIVNHLGNSSDHH